MELPQVKSKQRVADHGEVYTNPREVNAMLDLVKEQSFSLSATFLEPACGNGNFLIEILRRKLRSLAEQYGKQPLAYDTHLLQVVGSIYGIDILPDNIAECRERLFNGIMDKNVAFFGYIASNGQKCCSFLDRYLDNTKTTLPLPYLYKRK